MVGRREGLVEGQFPIGSHNPPLQGPLFKVCWREPLVIASLWGTWYRSPDNLPMEREARTLVGSVWLSRSVSRLL